MRLRVSVDVNASPALVFETATDVANWSTFISAIDRIEVLTPGPVDVGTRFRETRRMLGREATEEMTIAELDPPRRFLLTAESHGTRYRAVHRIEPAPGGARLTLEVEGRPQTFASRVLSPLGWMLKATVARQLETDLADLKREAERRAAASSG